MAGGTSVELHEKLWWGVAGDYFAGNALQAATLKACIQVAAWRSWAYLFFVSSCTVPY